jgi:hypothetical protein
MQGAASYIDEEATRAYVHAQAQGAAHRVVAAGAERSSLPLIMARCRRLDGRRPVGGFAAAAASGRSSRRSPCKRVPPIKLNSPCPAISACRPLPRWCVMPCLGWVSRRSLYSGARWCRSRRSRAYYSTCPSQCHSCVYVSIIQMTGGPASYAVHQAVSGADGIIAEIHIRRHDLNRAACCWIQRSGKNIIILVHEESELHWILDSSAC